MPATPRLNYIGGVPEDFFFRVIPAEGTGPALSSNPPARSSPTTRGEAAAELTVTLADKKVYKAKILAKDPRNDLALIRIDTGRKLPSLPLGNSDTLMVGQKVLAIGNHSDLRARSPPGW